nr:MAG TPA: hypothetical protein [Caudoviricetes sp.]
MSDDFTTIPRLFYWRNYDYWLRLFQKLLRLFQPERYDYCSPLLAIGRKPEKSCGGSRQWFRAARRAPAAGLPRRVERASRCTVTAGRCQIASRRDDPAGLAWYAICYTVLHGSITGGAPLHPYIHYYNRAAVLARTASGVARSVQYRQMHPPHNGGKTRQIEGKVPIKPCVLFCGVGGITA